MPVMMLEIDENGELCIISIDLREQIALFMELFLEDHWQGMFSSEMAPDPLCGI